MAYKLLKKVIASGNYDREDILTKLDVYYGFDRITQAQYEELQAMVA